MQAVSAELGSSGQTDSDQQEKNKKKKEDKKRDVEERGWIVMEAGDHTIRLANGSDAQILANEVSLLFKVIETLKSKTAALESSRKMISEMTSQGFKSDRRLRVVFKDGLPRYLDSGFRVFGPATKEIQIRRTVQASCSKMNWKVRCKS